MHGWFRFLKGTPCFTLLMVQLLGVVAYPFMEGDAAGRAAFSTFGLLVLVLIILAIRATPFLTWVSMLIGAPAVVLLVLQIVTGSDTLFAWSSGFEAVLYFYAASSMLVYMLKDEQVTIDELFAIGAVFTLLAWAFAYVFVVVQALQPGSFGGGPEGMRTWMELLFLSFTTLTNSGLSDIVPALGHARSAVMLEEVAGVLYIAMVITRLVGLRAARARL